MSKRIILSEREIKVIVTCMNFLIGQANPIGDAAKALNGIAKDEISELRKRLGC